MVSLSRLTAVVLALVLSGSTAFAADVTKIKFSLDWKLQGIHAWFFWGLDKGYFAKENLDVTIDQGEGSAGTVTRVMSGAYDAGFGDANALIQYAATKPGEAPLIVYNWYSRAPFALLTKASSSIHTVKDLEGKKVGGPASGATAKLLPLIAKKNGIDPAKFSMMAVSPALQEQLLLQGQVDTIAIFTVTSYINLISLGQDPDKDFRWIYFADIGADLYSNCIIVSQKLAKEKPEAVKAFVRVLNRSMKEVREHPDEAIDLLAKHEPLLKKDIEKQRLLFAYKTLIDTPEVRKIGVGDVDDTRLAESVTMIKEAFDLPSAPKPSDVFSRAFLPPKAERMLPPVSN